MSFVDHLTTNRLIGMPVNACLGILWNSAKQGLAFDCQILVEVSKVDRNIIWNFN